MRFFLLFWVSVLFVGSGLAQDKALSFNMQLMHTTVRIECVIPLKEQVAGGPQARISQGTGFFYSFLDNGQTQVPVIVTNRHVVEGAVKGAFWLTPKNAEGLPDYENAKRLEFLDFGKRWIPHPDPNVDLCIMPLGAVLNHFKEKYGQEFFFKTIGEQNLPADDLWESFEPADEILLVGYPAGIWDSKHNSPLIRSGITATYPFLDFENKPDFLIDAAIIQGSSGSPVWLLNDGDPNGFRFPKKPFFVGVLYAMVDRSTDVGIVVKSHQLKAFEPVLRELFGK